MENFFKVGSSKVQKTNVRIVAATNVDMQEAIAKEKFREDLYYRLSTVEIAIPLLCGIERKISPCCFANLLLILQKNTACPPAFRRTRTTRLATVSLEWKHQAVAQHRRTNVRFRNGT